MLRPCSCADNYVEFLTIINFNHLSKIFSPIALLCLVMVWTNLAKMSWGDIYRKTEELFVSVARFQTVAKWICEEFSN